MIVPTVSYWSENLVTTGRNVSRIQAYEMKSLRYVKKSTRKDRIPNLDICRELEISLITHKIEEWEKKLFRQLEKVADDTVLRQALFISQKLDFLKTKETMGWPWWPEQMIK